MKNPRQQTFRGGRSGPEPMVWFCASGLGLCLLMISFLLGLVAWEGITVFWPDKVAEITLREGAGETVSGSLRFAGMIVGKRHNPKRAGEEWQLMTGNKEVYGTRFHYVDRVDIREIVFPPGIAVAERVEYGRAVFYPLALDVAGNRIETGQAGFRNALRTAIREARQRFKEINLIERREIGAINREVNELKRRQRHLERRIADGKPVDPERLERISGRIEVLNREFAVLAEQVRELRVRQAAGTLLYRLPTGGEKRQAIGEILHLHWPNDMNLLQRLVYFLRQVGAFLSEYPREANTEGGIFPAIFGTFVMTVLMSAAVVPLGVITALYLHEYARQGPFVRLVRIGVNNLAGVPSIVYGVFGLGFFVYFLGGTIDQLFFSRNLPNATFGTGGILWASLTLALMTVPVVIVATEEALAAVPRGVREASLACGASKWQTIQRIILPASAPGIITGLILAMARGAGEVAPLMLVGVVKLAPSLPIDGEVPFIHLDRKFMHLGFHIYDLGFQSPDSEAARPMVFATTLLLIVLVVGMNISAIHIRNRLRAQYKTSTF